MFSPLMLGLLVCGVLFLLLVMPSKKKPPQSPALAMPFPGWPVPQPVLKTNREIEMEEDAALIAAHFRSGVIEDQRQAALARMSRYMPTATPAK